MQRALSTFLLALICLSGCATPVSPVNGLPQATLTAPDSNRATDVFPLTATVTSPPARPPVDVLQQATAYTPVLSGSLTLKNQIELNMILDGQYLYWIVVEQEDTIFRMLLNGGPTEKFVTSKFKGGNVTVRTPIRAGNWFLYFDHNNSGTEPDWNLWAKNMQDGSEKVVLSGKGGFTTPYDLNYSASGEWLAWSHTIPQTQTTCEQSVLGLINLNTNEQIELDRNCIDQYIWTIVQLSGQTLVAEQDFPDFKGGGHSLYLFNDVLRKQYIPLADHNASMPQISPPWIVWKNGPRFEYSKSNTLYNLNDETRQAVIAPGESPSDPRLAGQWLHWISIDVNRGYNIFLYDLKREQAWKMPAPNEGIFMGVTTNGQWIIWSRSGKNAKDDWVLEWAKLP